MLRSFDCRVSFFIFLLLLTSYGSIAQDKSRPKIGLVLSGGGAKGLAHIGIINAMEDAGLYPDYITGTSMGSIVGGLYAIGYSAADVDSIARVMDWDRLLTNEIPLNLVAFEEKRFYGRYIMELPFVGGKLELPRGFIEGQALTLKMSNITRPAHHISDFNEFPIPFACIGANVENGEADIFNSGLLPETLRASMAIPTIFTPMEIDSSMYVDGGLVRNFPVQEVIDMGADIVIGVSVGTGLQPKEDLKSMVSVMDQVTSFAGAHDTEEQKKLVDIMIEPDLEGFSSSSFSNAEGILALGYKTGKEYFPVFKQLADSLNKLGFKQQPKLSAKNPSYYSFQNIRIEGNSRVPDELIKGKIRFEPGKEFTINELEDRISLLYGTLYFDKIVYSINPVTSTLTIKVRESQRASIKMAMHYDTENKAGVNMNYTLRNFLMPGSRLIGEFDLAQNPFASLSYFKYIGKYQNFAMIIDADWIRAEVPSFWDEVAEGDDVSVISGLLQSSNSQVGMAIQGTYASNQTIKLGAHYISNNLRPYVLDSIYVNIGGTAESVALKKLNNSALDFSFYYGLNTLNKQYFPQTGSLVNLRFSYIVDRTVDYEFQSGGLGIITGNIIPDNIWKVSLTFKKYFPVTPKISIYSKASLTMSDAIESIENLAYRSFIGGFRPTLVHSQEYNGAPSKRFNNMNYFYLNLGLQWEIFNKLYLNFTSEYIESEYPMKWLYKPAVTNDFGAYARRLSFSGMVSYNSVLGPVSVGVAKDQYLKGVQGFFSLGYYINRN